MSIGLSNDEVAFHDAITQNGAAALEIGDGVLRELTHKLVETVRSKAKLNWTKREAVRAVTLVASKSRIDLSTLPARGSYRL